MWGNWRLKVDNLTLEHKDGKYYVDLESVVSSAELADWIFQISMKSWASTEDVGNLVRALDAIFYPQANLCSGGRDKHLNAKVYLEELFSAEPVR